MIFCSVESTEWQLFTVNQSIPLNRITDCFVFAGTGQIGLVPQSQRCSNLQSPSLFLLACVIGSAVFVICTISS